MTQRQPAINPTLLIQDGGADVGPRRGINLGDGLTLSSDEDGIVTVDGGGGSSLQPIRIETTSYNPVPADDGFLLRFQTTDSVNFINLTAGAFPVGFTFDIVYEGTQRLAILGVPGQTVFSRGDRFEANGQYARARVQLIAENTWLLDGDLTQGPN